MVRQQMKLAAVLAVVVLALTGFSTSSHGHGHSGSSHGSDDGGGCSNSRKSNGYSSGSTTDDYDDDYGSSSGSSSDSATATDEPTPDPTAVPTTDPGVRVLRCARPADGSQKAVTSSLVELSPANYGTAEVDITVTFADSASNTVDTAHLRVELDASESLDPQDFTVPMKNPGKVDEVYDCYASAVLVTS
ncbi:hypothetical protein [Streptomyces sp. NPDC002690]